MTLEELSAQITKLLDAIEVRFTKVDTQLIDLVENLQNETNTLRRQIAKSQVQSETRFEGIIVQLDRMEQKSTSVTDIIGDLVVEVKTLKTRIDKLESK